MAVGVALFFCSLYLPIYSPAPLTGIEWILVGGWAVLGVVFFTINKLSKKDEITKEQIEYLIFGDKYKRF